MQFLNLVKASFCSRPLYTIYDFLNNFITRFSFKWEPFIETNLKYLQQKVAVRKKHILWTWIDFRLTLLLQRCVGWDRSPEKIMSHRRLRPSFLPILTGSSVTHPRASLKVQLLPPFPGNGSSRTDVKFLMGILIWMVFSKLDRRVCGLPWRSQAEPAWPSAAPLLPVHLPSPLSFSPSLFRTVWEVPDSSPSYKAASREISWVWVLAPLATSSVRLAWFPTLYHKQCWKRPPPFGTTPLGPSEARLPRKRPQTRATNRAATAFAAALRNMSSFWRRSLSDTKSLGT